MKYKGILLDFDNTLYNYKNSHEIGMSEVYSYVKNSLNIDLEDFKNIFYLAKQSIHIELANSASSHNRLLYFQRCCEMLEIKQIMHALKMYNIYWNAFIDSIVLYDGVFDFVDVPSFSKNLENLKLPNELLLVSQDFSYEYY